MKLIEEYSFFSNKDKIKPSDIDFDFTDFFIRIRGKNIGIAIKFHSTSFYIPYKQSLKRILKLIKEVKANGRKSLHTQRWNFTLDRPTFKIG